LETARIIIIEEIRARILIEFPLTREQLSLKRPEYKTTVFVNKVAFAFNRLVSHKPIMQIVRESYRITDHGRDVAPRHRAEQTSSNGTLGPALLQGCPSKADMKEVLGL
jgi:hypothetical protein